MSTSGIHGTPSGTQDSTDVPLQFTAGRDSAFRAPTPRTSIGLHSVNAFTAPTAPTTGTTAAPLMFSTHYPTFTNPSTPPLQPVQPHFTSTTLPGHSYGLHPQVGHSFAQPTPIPTMVPPMGLPSFSGSTATFNQPAPFLSPTHPTYPTLPSPHFTPPKFINAMLWVDTSTNPSPHILRTRYPDATNPLYTDILPTRLVQSNTNASWKLNSLPLTKVDCNSL